jgi:MFS transporter, DHA1 family, inner membrane transport protein
VTAGPTTEAPVERSVRAQLLTLTGAKVVSNTALRWVGPFLPTLERAFGASTGTLTGIMGAAELGGLTTMATGSHLDRGRERVVFVAGLGLISAGCLVSLGGTTWTFALGFAMLVVGIANHTAAGHTWIGHRIPFRNRSRAIGVFETSWAIALLLGAPIIAVLIDWFGWRGPYVALAVGLAVAAAAVAVKVDSTAVTPDAAHRPAQRQQLPRSAWAPMLASACTAMAGIGIFVVSGAWLDDDYGVSTGGLGLIAALFGAVELVSSLAVAGYADRLGARRSVLGGLVLVAVGLAVMGSAGASQAVAVAGLAVFLTGFEYGFVSSLTLVTEAAPEARGKAIGVSNALGTIARSTSLILSGQLYEAFGIAGSMAMAACAAVAAATLTTLGAVQSRRASVHPVT